MNTKGKVAVLSNTIIGIGVVSVGFTIRAGGLALGTAILVLTGFLSYLSLRYLSEVFFYTGITSYKETSRAILGRRGAWFTSLALFLLTFGSITGYFSFLGQSIPDVLSYFGVSWEGGGFWFRASVVSAAVLLFVLPLTLYKNINKLSFTSTISIIAASVVTLVVVTKSVLSYQKGEWNFDPDGFTYVRFGREFFVSIPISSFAFLCQISFYPIFSGVSESERRKPQMLGFMKKVSLLSIILTMCVYLLIAISGYLEFRDKTHGDILTNYPASDLLATVARSLMSVTIIFSAPVFFFSCRLALAELTMGWSDESASSGRTYSKWYDKRAKFYVVTVLTLAASVTIAIIVPDIISVFSVTSAIAGSLIIYIFPGIFRLRLNDYEKDKEEAEPMVEDDEEAPAVIERKFWGPVLFIIYGVITGAVCTVASLMQAFDASARG